MTLIIEWEGEKKKICETASANRRSKLYDHFLGATSYAQIEHKYLSENPDALTMPPTLLAKRAYTPPQGYENVEGNDKKVEKINELNAALEASQNDVFTRVTLSRSTEDTPVEPNRMTRDEWMEVVDGAYGLHSRKKGRVPLSSTRVKTLTTTNKPSSQSVTSTRHGDTSYVVGKIGKYLMKNVEIPLALSFLPTIKHELSGAQTTWDVVQRLIDSQPVKDLLPQSIYADIMVLAFDEHAAASGGEVRGGTAVGSSSTVRHPDAAATDDRDHDDRDHDYNE
ncbi:uncharacterized protein LOC109839751 isoform X1 [Asparagus officinalis]|uniref:uncharacterized protein LOC109839751 isoform X1 n=1 Tax=Asparagus officinalis TaxID=4686 RepID=UPI00098E385B|nr:uncharacterized protein LOC109839751 isoform X1 [Asparagus officinalis]